MKDETTERVLRSQADELEKKLLGISASDQERITTIVEELFAQPDFECAGITHQEFARPILEACQEITGAG